MELVENSGDQPNQLGYDPWQSDDFHGRNDIVQDLSNSYKALPVASVVDSSSVSTVMQSPGKLAMQRWTPAQAPKIDLARTSQADNADAVVSKLRSSKKPVGDS